jgi:hypothetical protein
MLNHNTNTTKYSPVGLNVCDVAIPKFSNPGKVKFSRENITVPKFNIPNKINLKMVEKIRQCTNILFHLVSRILISMQQENVFVYEFAMINVYCMVG